MKPLYRAYLDLALAMTLAGSSVAVGKVITQDIPIFVALTIRFLIALPPLIVLSKRNKTFYIPKQPILFRVFLQALTGVFLFNVFLLFGLKFTSASQSGLLTSTSPAFIALLGFFFLGDRVSRYEWLAITLTVAGIMVINTINATKQLASNSNQLLGNGLVIAAVICEALFTIFRKSSNEVPVILGAMWVTAFGLILCLPIGLYQLSYFDISAITAIQWVVFIYYGLFVSALAYFLWFRGLELASPTAAAILTGVLPISAIVFSIIFLGEVLTITHIIGLVLVLAAIFMMTRSSQTESEKQIE